MGYVDSSLVLGGGLVKALAPAQNDTRMYGGETPPKADPKAQRGQKQWYREYSIVILANPNRLPRAADGNNN